MSTLGPILCIGEVLWDSFPSGLFPGGAALNVAHDLHALGRPALLVSRVGKDFLGEDLLSRLARAGLSTAGVQIDGEAPTGFVRVALDREGSPRFEIVEGVAWDHITWGPELEKQSSEASGIIFGTLAQRSERSREAIRAARRACAGFTCCDVNLRPPHDPPDLVLESITGAELVKLNHEELARISAWAGLGGGGERAEMARLAERFRISTLCVTRGARGAALLRNGVHAEHPGYRVEVVDTVGAGDAFLAGLLDGILAGGQDLEALLDWANACGAHVATHAGAAPAMNRAGVKALLARLERQPTSGM